MKKIILLFIGISLLNSCFLVKDKSLKLYKNFPGNTPSAWSYDEVNGYDLFLISDKSYGSFSFRTDEIDGRYVICTIGTKKMLAGPVYQWNINDKGELIISDYDKQNIFTFEKIIIDIESNILYAHYNNSNAVFTYKKD